MQIRFDDGEAWNLGGGVGNTLTISDAGDSPELISTPQEIC